MGMIERSIKGQFVKGVSGNPKGRPKGNTLASQIRASISDDDINDIMSKLIAQAKAGDTASAKLILDRISPPLKEQPLYVDLERLTGTLASKADAMQAVLQAFTTGQATTQQAITLADMVQRVNHAQHIADDKFLSFDVEG